MWCGQAVSQLGNGMYIIALAIETTRIDKRPSALAIVLGARVAPTALLLLVGGAAADRFPRRRAMIASDLTRGGAVAVVATLLAAGEVRLWTLVALSILFGVGDSFFAPAESSILPELLPEELLQQGNALSTTSSEFAQGLVGPSIGGVAVGFFGTAWTFGIDAATFAVSIGCLIAMTAGGRPQPSSRSLVGDAVAGLRYISGRRWLYLTIIGAGVANLVGFAPFSVLMPLLVRRDLHGGGLALGLVTAAGGAGGVAAGLIAARLTRPRRRIVVMWACWALVGVAALGQSVAGSTWLVGVLNAGVLGFTAYGDILVFGLIQSEIPKEMLGRTFSVVRLLAFGFTPVGTVGAGFLADALGVRQTLAACAAAYLLPALVVFIPGAQEPDQRTACVPDTAHRGTGPAPAMPGLSPASTLDGIAAAELGEA